MKFFLVLALCATVAVAFSPVDSKDAQIIRSHLDNIGVSEYNFAVETSDGKSVQESGVLKNVGTENEAMEVRGSFSYSTDGVVYSVEYVADENGFRPSGAHLPVPPKA